jgi:proteasome accessory factor C
VVLELQPDARWVAEYYPVEQVDDDGSCLRVTLAVTARPWLERLLVRLGPSAKVVDGPDDLRHAASDAAERILARYVDMPLR